MSLVDQAQEQNALAFEQELKAALAERVGAAIDAKKVEVAQTMFNESLEHNSLYIVGHVKPEHRERYSGKNKVIVGGPYDGMDSAKTDSATFKDHPHYSHTSIHDSHTLNHLRWHHEVENK
jgi:hypothetical protein